MTYREQRKGQWIGLHVIALGLAMQGVYATYNNPWALIVIEWLSDQARAANLKFIDEALTTDFQKRGK